MGLPGSSPPPSRSSRAPVVLIVDDHDDTRDIYAAWLAAAGLETHVASNAMEALALAERRRLDAIVLDIGLPGTSGAQLSRELRSRPRTKPTILIAVSGFPREVGNEGAFDSYLLKPCLPQALLDEILRLIAIHRRGSIPPSAEVA